jgi:hypothetical protein
MTGLEKMIAAAVYAVQECFLFSVNKLDSFLKNHIMSGLSIRS